MKIPQPYDLAVAAGLLTRLPISLNFERAKSRSANAVWAYPVVGIALGLFISGLLLFCAELKLGFALSLILVLALSTMLTGAMHEDGLADTADGLWGGYDPERRLAIMKDSQIGTYGVMALIFIVLLRLFCYWDTQLPNLFWLLPTAYAASRVPLVFAMVWMRNARADGLSASVGAPPFFMAVLAATIAAGFAIYGLGPIGLIVVLIAWIAPIPLFVLAQRRIGGQTGDILGASQQITEIAVVLAYMLVA